MSRFVQPSDFAIGDLQISQNSFKKDDLQQFIDEVEPSILQDMLGCTLYDAMILDWDTANPTVGVFSEQRFIDIYEPFCKDESCDIKRSEGIKRMVMYVVYYTYLNVLARQNRINGIVKGRSENAVNIPNRMLALFAKYNSGIKTYRTMQWFICDNSDDYTEYNGQLKQYMSWI